MKTNKNKTINDNRLAIAGVQKHFASTPALLLDGTTMTPKDVIATLQAAIDTIDRSTTAEKAFHDAVAAQNAAIAQGNATLSALKMLVKNQLGSTQGDFGFTTPTRQTPSEATKAAAVAKRAATRAARHTAGKRQKATVKGVVAPAPATPPTAANQRDGREGRRVDEGADGVHNPDCHIDDSAAARPPCADRPSPHGGH
jgi:hypothetical protein